MIRYISTRGRGEPRTAASAVIKGISEDKGLFVPETVPGLPFKPADMVGRKYKDVARAVIAAFFDDYTEEEIQSCVDGAYDNKFEAEDIVPVKEAGGVHFLELYHGRTAAFKDMALSILPYLMTTAVRKENEDKKIVILTATSGDTGKAALEGFADVEGTEIIVFYPSTGVSEVQKRQMTTQEGANTHVFGIRGNFDDAQTGVKKIFDDQAFNEELMAAGCRLSSANSINIGRLIPQVAYYVYGYIRLIGQGVIRDGDPVNIVVPTGNFGNILASYYASLMGIPVKKFICASNRNKILTDFINTGVYDTHREFHVTCSPSMDILISSNLERLIYHISGDSSKACALFMKDLKETGKYNITDQMREQLSDFVGGYATEEQTAEEIRMLYDKYGYVIDPHTAVASSVYRRYRAESGDFTPAVIDSTASPFKFEGSVMKALGRKTDLPDLELADQLSEVAGVSVPKAVSDLKDAPIMHDIVCDRKDMEKEVRKFLGI